MLARQNLSSPVFVSAVKDKRTTCEGETRGRTRREHEVGRNEEHEAGVATSHVGSVDGMGGT